MSSHEPCANQACKGHKRYVGGGSMDGQVRCMTFATPSDYPQTLGTVLRGGTRSWYEIDYEASDGPEAVYRFIGYGKEFPQQPARGEAP
ncbi:hypothetical protein ACGFNU_21480 [Spirillospora sp. NPDC048911]|uniref:hypothetical protein n=1 Tax=Spirillospora sp. NPDC048911 TaxID=3364527 RepID=UPI0037248B8C